MHRHERESVTDPEAQVPARSPAGPAAAPLAAVLALQRTAGNAAVAAMVARQPAAPAAAAETPAIAELRKLLDAEDEEKAIGQMAVLSDVEADRVLSDPKFRELAVSCFGDSTMARAMVALKAGQLSKRLRWMFAEDTSWKLVRPLLADPAIDGAVKRELYNHNDLRSAFTGICNDEEMADAVSLMGGTLEQRLNWMFAEGTSWKVVKTLLQSRDFDADQRNWVLSRDYLRSRFTEICDDEEMVDAVRLLGGTLEQRLRWCFAEGSSWKLLRGLLTDEGVSADDRKALYPKNDLRSKFTEILDDDEMAELVKLMGGHLSQKLNWMFAEGTNWKAVRSLISDTTVPAEEKTHLYNLDYMRSYFVELCGDAEMAETVKILGGKLLQKLDWMVAEGFGGAQVFDVIRRTPDAEQMTLPLPGWLDKGLRSELSGANYKLAVRMLTEGLLTWESIDDSRIEPHLELKDPKDPTKGYESQDYRVKSIYDIEYTRTALRVRVRIKLTGETTDAQHRKIWTDGIDNAWKNKFHVENGRRIPIILVPEFTSSNSHHSIEIHPPVNKATEVWRENAANWYAGPSHDSSESSATQDTTSAEAAAHEFGHLAGLADEYNLSAADYQRLIGTAPPAGPTPASGHTDTTSIMGEHTAGTVQGRHMRPFVDWLNAHRAPGEKPYRLVAGP